MRRRSSLICLILDDARGHFREIHSTWSQRLDEMCKKYGKAIQTSRPYYEAKNDERKLREEAQAAALRFERANSMLQVAKQQVKLTQDSLNRQTVIEPECLEVSSWHLPTSVSLGCIVVSYPCGPTAVPHSCGPTTGLHLCGLTIVAQPRSDHRPSFLWSDRRPTFVWYDHRHDVASIPFHSRVVRPPAHFEWSDHRPIRVVRQQAHIDVV